MADNTDRANPVIAKWQKWRNADHEDAAVLTRGEIITLLEEPRRLSARVAELEAHANRYAEECDKLKERAEKAEARIRELEAELTALRALNKGLLDHNGQLIREIGGTYHAYPSRD